MSIGIDNPTCYHCGLPVPAGLDIRVDILGKPRDMCCYGCEAVARTIVNSGMQDFYRYRSKLPQRPEEIVPDFVQQLRVYDNPLIQEQFVDGEGDIRQTSLILEGIVCAACVWLNEQHLKSLPGVLDAQVNYASHRARIRWDNHRVRLSQILEAISRIGYRAHPYDPDRQQQLVTQERKQQLGRIGLAGVLGMQIMILAVAMYSGDWWGMEPIYRNLFRWLSLGLALPILLVSARPFFSAAWRDLRHRRVGMDVPVALGIAIAFGASLGHTISGQGEVYYDSVAMFTFFLLSARFFEMSARKRTAESTESLLKLQPAIATRLDSQHGLEQQATVPVAELVPGDRVLVRPGENIPVDGVVLDGASGVNESLITGESLPIQKAIGDDVVGGSTNGENPLVVRVDKTGEDTVLASIQHLLEDAQSRKPVIAQLANRIAARFVAVILLLAAGVALYWYNTDPARWIEITIATLVVTCPCALSLATPTALTAANGRLARLGLLPARSHALETLAQVTDFVFDKTGTLTEGQLHLVKIVALGDKSEHDYVQIAAALEAGSEHPIAHCLRARAGTVTLSAGAVENTAGGGIAGTLDDQRWQLGNLKHIQATTGAAAVDIDDAELEQRTLVALADERRIHALFAFDDSVRDEAAALVQKLKAAGKHVLLMTGDRAAAAHRIADQLGIEQVFAELKPDDKLAQVRVLQQQGRIVAMTGDGINDAPVLAGADVSIAMGSGTQLAAANADMILLSKHIEYIYTGFRLARKTLVIIRQNLGWAIAYNVLAVPAAAMGYVAPWLAALGMSASSLIVVLNALRITRHE